MRRSVRDRIILVLLLLALFAPAGVPVVSAASVSGEPVATAGATEPAVTDLPATGHGARAASDVDRLAWRHSVVTALVLIAAAVLSLALVGVGWRYDRQ